MSEDLWHDKQNAETYADYAESHTMYSGWGKALVDSATPRSGDVILDLACGGGASTRAIRERTPAECTILGTDYSSAQIEVAQQRSSDDSIHYLVSAAEQVHLVLPTPANIVTCSCAVWFFDFPKVLESLAKCTTTDVRFVFNATCDPIAARPDATTTDRPDILTRARELATTRYGYSTPASSPCDRWYQYHIQDYLDWFNASPFRITNLKARYEGTDSSNSEAKTDWWDIPVFLCSHLPGLTYEQAKAVFQAARKEIDSERNRSEASTSANVQQQKQFKGWIYCAERL
jgi:ubiquinone/menaquinone biosynthesis C-methylase UbiE